MTSILYPVTNLAVELQLKTSIIFLVVTSILKFWNKKDVAPKTSCYSQMYYFLFEFPKRSWPWGMT